MPPDLPGRGTGPPDAVGGAAGPRTAPRAEELERRRDRVRLYRRLATLRTDVPLRAFCDRPRLNALAERPHRCAD